MQKFQDVVADRRGNVKAGASVLVKTLAGVVATIYSDDGVTTVANPLTTDANGGFSFYAADGRYTLTVSGMGLTTRTITDVLLEDPVEQQASDLMGWALVQAFRVVSATRNDDGAITTASIVWPDGVAGVYTADTLSTDFPGATDAWSATYLGSTTKTVTQPAVTRDSNGAVTVQPAITIV